METGKAGYLFKLKESGKEWKKLYVVLRATEIVYYDSPLDAQHHRPRPDGVKICKGVERTAPPPKAKAPVAAHKAAYFIIETTHARKIFCTRSEDDRDEWVEAIQANAAAAARVAMQRRAMGGKSGSAPASGGGLLGGLFRSKAKPTVAAKAPRPNLASAKGPELSAEEEATNSAYAELLKTMGLPSHKMMSMLAMPIDKKREMLEMYATHRADAEEGGAAATGSGRTATSYAQLLRCQPTLEQLQELAVTLESANAGWVAAFLAADALEHLSALLEDLCRFDERPESDWLKVDAAMACAAALTRTDEGMASAAASARLCRSFASGGGSLLLTERSGANATAVDVLCAMALYSPAGHATVIGAIERLAEVHLDDGGSEGRFRPLIQRLGEPRNDDQAKLLQLLNAVVSGAADMATRVVLRDELCAHEFLELTRELNSDNDDAIDAQIAIFDREMNADLHDAERGEQDQPPTAAEAATDGGDSRVAALEAELEATRIELTKLRVASSGSLEKVAPAADDGAGGGTESAEVASLRARLEGAETKAAEDASALEEALKHAIELQAQIDAKSALQEEALARADEATKAKEDAVARSSKLEALGASQKEAADAGAIASRRVAELESQVAELTKKLEEREAAPAAPLVPPPLAPPPIAGAGPPAPPIPGGAPPPPPIPGGAPPPPPIPGGAPPPPPIPGGAPPPPPIMGAPPPPIVGGAPPPPPPIAGGGPPPPPPIPGALPPPPVPGAPPPRPGAPPPIPGAPGPPVPSAPAIAPKSKAAPSVPMKALHWSKVPDAKLNGTVWLDSSFDEAAAKLDVSEVESLFTAGRRESAMPTNLGEAKAPAAAPKNVQLIDVKRSNNVSIALARLRKSNDELKACLLDPEKHVLSAEQVSAMLNIIPTADEVETVREYAGDRETLGKVEQLFLVLADVDALEPRLKALQTTLNYTPQALALSEELTSLIDACEQVRSSKALLRLLERVLALGNHLNGTSNRGGAYGFKLADLAKLVQVKSADNKTTLLHYLARITAAAGAGADLEALHEELSQAELVRSVDLAEKRGELAKLAASLEAVKRRRDAGKVDEPFTKKLADFVASNEKNLSKLQSDFGAAETKLKELATWIGERPNVGVADVFGPLASIVKALEKAQKDNLREAAEEERRAKGPAVGGSRKPSVKPGGGTAPPGGAGAPPGGPNMMLEMQLKMAQRAAAAGGGGVGAAGGGGARGGAAAAAAGDDGIPPWKRELAARKKAGGVGARLAQDAESGAIFAARRLSIKPT